MKGFYKGTRLLILVMSALYTFMPCHAFSLKITDIHDNYSIFNVDENLILEVRNDNLSVRVPGGRHEFNITNLKSFDYIASSPSNVNTIEATARVPEIRLSSDKIYIRTLSDTPSSYTIFNIGGAIIEKKYFLGEVEFSLSGFSPGIYILSLPGIPSLKFLIK